ncbi:hypothetical protein [Micromonospora sp. NPDC051141]|uniref:hypothetical protein n=1 Tax=Micromonospora sp. NPDC051141 TaxID=3364284 RepID=UPI0037B4F762
MDARKVARPTAGATSMRLAAKRGFTELERFYAWDAEQRLGTDSSTTAMSCGGRGPVRIAGRASRLATIRSHYW